MTDIEMLYETIFCSEFGAKHRAELLDQFADKLDELKFEHQKSGMKINGEPIAFDWMVRSKGK